MFYHTFWWEKPFLLLLSSGPPPRSQYSTRGIHEEGDQEVLCRLYFPSRIRRTLLASLYCPPNAPRRIRQATSWAVSDRSPVEGGVCRRAKYGIPAVAGRSVSSQQCVAHWCSGRLQKCPAVAGRFSPARGLCVQPASAWHGEPPERTSADPPSYKLGCIRPLTRGGWRLPPAVIQCVAQMAP